MNVNEAKAQITKVLIELQATGIWVTDIEVIWQSNVEGDVPKPRSTISCTLKLQADLK